MKQWFTSSGRLLHMFLLLIFRSVFQYISGLEVQYNIRRMCVYLNYILLILLNYQIQNIFIKYYFI